MDPDRVEHVGVGRGENLRHRAARRQPGGEHALPADAELLRQRLREARELGGFAGSAALMPAVEPVPAGGGVGAARLARVGDDEAEFLGESVHLRAEGEVFRVLPAAVQHEDEREIPPFMGGRDIEPVVERSRGVAIRPLEESFAEVGLDLARRYGGGRGRRPDAQSAQGFAQRTARGKRDDFRRRTVSLRLAALGSPRPARRTAPCG